MIKFHSLGTSRSYCLNINKLGLIDKVTFCVKTEVKAINIIYLLLNYFYLIVLNEHRDI